MLNSSGEPNKSANTYISAIISVPQWLWFVCLCKRALACVCISVCFCLCILKSILYHYSLLLIPLFHVYVCVCVSLCVCIRHGIPNRVLCAAKFLHSVKWTGCVHDVMGVRVHNAAHALVCNCCCRNIVTLLTVSALRTHIYICIGNIIS